MENPELQFNENMLGYCGVYCEQCSVKRAFDEQDREHIRHIPHEVVAKYRSAEKDLSAYKCDGCRGEHCICRCDIKPCALRKNVNTCADCNEFPCERMNAFENDGIPYHKDAMDHLRKIKKYGVASWFNSLKPLLMCRKCGKRQSWFYTCPLHQIES